VAVAGIDHVYHKCRMGLIDNLKPLKRDSVQIRRYI